MGPRALCCSALGVNVLGLMQKALLGDLIGRIIDPSVAQAKVGPVLEGHSWLALGFSFQILFDLSGLMPGRAKVCRRL